jgi:hypothetical protein
MVLHQEIMTSALNAMSGQFYFPAISVQSAIQGYVGHNSVLQLRLRRNPLLF